MVIRPSGRAKVAQTPGRGRVKIINVYSESDRVERYPVAPAKPH